ncbi:putative membrane protein c3b8.06 [Acrodontium crateriforme]|uniref:Membrane protein c3b8.06 n=1 Tax=Acrodontium crateriforme TaxID=150365 RepID=A0AAQ3LXR8_9PEZI|nr:putative membrane protein c3b8.06 [Acrodontium crateriforme]
MRTQQVAVTLSAALLLGALPLIAAHGDEQMDTDMMMPTPATSANPTTSHQAPPSYFSHIPYTGWMISHIASMIVGWIFVLPAAIMLSVAQSRYSLPTQLVFHLINGLGVVSGFIYNHATPDLYAGNSHHPLGWIVSSFTVVWTLMSVVVAYGDFAKRRSNQRHVMTMQAMARHDNMHAFVGDEQARWSGDSGQGTERNSASLSLGSRQNSFDGIHQKPEVPPSPLGPDEDDDDDSENRGFLGNSRVDRYLSSKIRKVSSRRIASVIRGMHLVLEKFLLLLGFTAILTGFVTYGGIFRNREIFSGAAHFVKGGIFFWYGLLTLGRWMGAFAEFGWAWNIRPQHPLVARWKTRVPSAEFTESFVIWLYGASNVFLEHLNAWGQDWSAQDFEHVSITALFFGGGLLGMLLESTWIRNSSLASVEVQHDAALHHQIQDPEPGDNEAARWRKPPTYALSMNPMPAIVIMLLGTLMSSHKQPSMTSSMLHAQWGGLFLAFALARAVTYLTLYLRPPTSYYAARPPSELVAAFCLTAGGLVFKLSAHDVVNSIEGSGVHATAVFTVCMGLTGIILSWEVVCLAIKGWAVKKERK